MSDKKHIDRLFQESFKDFEAAPSDSVWKNIEAELNQKKKKRRVIPIWWRYAGIAALLLLLLTVGITYFNADDKTPTNQVVETENTPSEKVIKKEVTTLDNSENNSEIKTAVVNDDGLESQLESSKDKNHAKEGTNKLKPSNESTIAETSASKNENKSKVNASQNTSLNAKNNVLNPSSKNVIANVTEEMTNDENLQNNSKNNTLITSSNKENNNGVKEERIISKEKAKELIKDTPKNKNAVAKTNDNDEETENTVDNKTENNTLTIEEALEKNKDIIEKESEKSNRWSIAPNAAPVYFNTLGEGSSLDPQFNSNAKSGELNMSYGISASYALNNKISVRSGINKVNLGYNTNNVIVFQSVGLSSSSSASNALQNVNYSINTQNDAVSVVSAANLNTGKIPEEFTTTNTSINQALGYIEIPLEIQYTLSDKKLGVNVIGGFSSFFLNNNEIFSETENGNRTFLGEANNINKVSYSANFGLGFNYQVSKKIDLNLEPMFKYQMNTFKNTSGNFTPFFIGVYTGFAIKF
jgi:hypothetical protein